MVVCLCLHQTVGFSHADKKWKSVENKTKTVFFMLRVKVHCEKKVQKFLLFSPPTFMGSCVWPRYSRSLDPQPGALPLLWHLIIPTCTKGSWSHGPNLACYKVCKGTTYITLGVFTCLLHKGKPLWRSSTVEKWKGGKKNTTEMKGGDP